MKKRKNQKNELVWRGISITVVETPRYIFNDSTHLELFVDGKTPLPVTNTGYRSHFILSKDPDRCWRRP